MKILLILTIMYGGKPGIESVQLENASLSQCNQIGELYKRKMEEEMRLTVSYLCVPS